MKKIELKKSPVVFKEDEHRYFLGDKELKGITSTLIHRAFPDKYKDIDPQVLANAAEKGHALHTAIEFFDNFGGNPEDAGDDRIVSYAALKEERGLTTIANEYLVSDEEYYASQIDIVMQDSQEEICLVDTKSTWTLDMNSTGLQLSIYKRYFERQNPDLKVAHIYVLWLPNKDHSICEFRELSVVSDDVIDALIEADQADVPFDIQATYGNLPSVVQSAEDEIIRIEAMLSQYKERYDTLKKGLYDLMEKYDVKSFSGGKVTLTRVLPTQAESLDSKKLKEEMPEIYEKYAKKTTRSGSLKITVKKQ